MLHVCGQWEEAGHRENMQTPHGELSLQPYCCEGTSYLVLVLSYISLAQTYLSTRGNQMLFLAVFIVLLMLDKLEL